MTPDSIKPLRAQWRPLLVVSGLLLTPLSLLLVAVGVIGLTTSVDIPHLVRDPAAVANVPFYTGFVSNVGVLGWVVAAAILLFAAAVLKRRSASAERVAFLRRVGAVTAVLALDDLFMIHDGLGPDVFGIPGLWFYAAYAVAVGGILVTHREMIWRSDYLVLATGLTLLAASMAFDAVHGVQLLASISPRAVGVAYLVEDGLKLLGIGGWLGYSVQLSYASLIATPPQDERLARKRDP